MYEMIMGMMRLDYYLICGFNNVGLIELLGISNGKFTANC